MPITRDQGGNGLRIRSRSELPIRVSFLALAVALACPWLAAKPADSYVFRKLQSTLREQGVELQATDFDYSVTGLSIQMRGVTARAVGTAAPPFFAADRVEAAVTLGTLTGGGLRITRAVLQKPVIRIVTDASGATNLPTPVQSSPSADRTPTFLIDLLTASAGELVIEDQSRSLTATIAGWNLRVEGSAKGNHAILLTGARRGGLTQNGVTLPLRNLSTALVLTPTGLRVEGLNAIVGDNRLQAIGRLDNLSAPSLDFTLQAEISPGQLLPLAGVATPVDGSLRVQAKIVGPLDRLLADCKIDGQLSAPDLPSVQIGAWVSADLGPAKTFRLAPLTLSSKAGKATIDGTLTTLESATSRVTLHLSGANLAEISELAGIKPRLEGVALTQLELSWPGLDIAKTQAEGAFEITPQGRQTARDRIPLALSGSLSSRPGDLRLNVSAAGALGIRLRGPVRLEGFPSLDQLSSARITGTLQGSIADAGKTLTQLDRLLGGLPEGAPRADELGGLVDFTLDLGGTVPDPKATLTARSADFRFRKFADVGVDLETTATRKDLTVNRLDLNWKEGSAGVSGKLAYASPAAGLEAVLRLRDLPLPELLKALDQNLPIDGRLDGDLQVSGSLERPLAEFRLLAEGLSGYGQPGGELTMAGRWDGQTAHLTEGRFVQEGPQPGAQATLQGSWDSESERFQIQAQGQNLRLVPAADLGNLAGVFDFAASGDGTPQQPNLQAEAAIRRLELDGNPAGDVTANLTVRDGQGRLEWTAPAFAATLSADFSTEPPRPFRLLAEFRELDLAALPVRQPEGVRLTGRLSGSAEAEGEFDQWRQATARLDVPELSLNLNGRDVAIAEPLRLRLRDQRLFIDAASFKAGLSRLDLGGEFPLDAESEGEIQASGLLELSDLEKWTTDTGVLYLEGAAKLDGSITGNLTRFEPDLRLTLDSATLAHDSLNSPVEDFGFELAVTSGAVRLRHLQARLDSALLSAEGEIPLALLVSRSGNNRSIAASATASRSRRGDERDTGIPEEPQHGDGGRPAAARRADGACREDSKSGGAAPHPQLVGYFLNETLGPDLPLQAAEGPARVQVKLQRFSPASLAAAPEGLTGNVSATVDAQADALDFEAVTAQAEFGQLDFTLEGYTLGQTSPTRLSLGQRIASVENFVLAGPSLNLQISGDTLLFDPQMYDLRVTGDLDASVVSRFVENLNATGVTRLEASLAGPLDAPELNGYLEATDIDLRLRSPRLQGEKLNLRLDFAGDRVEIARLSGQINGGPISGSGGFQWAGAQPSNVSVDVDAKEVFLNFPPGLRTLSDVGLRLRSRDGDLVLGGQINVADGSFTENIDLESRLLQLIRSGGPELPAEPNPFLQRLRYDVAVNTVNPLLINNNLAKLEMNVDLTARGNYYRPGLTGNINLEEGGELYLREKTYIVDRGTVLLLDQTRIAPTLDILARTKAGRYDITLKISGPPDDLDTVFTSDPALPEPDIIAVLITGRTLDELRGAEANVAKEQTLSYLTGTFGSRLGAEAEKALGLSKVRIEPNLIAPESSPGARLTIGEDLTRDLRLIYSTNLVDSGDQIYIAEYDVTRRFLTRGIKQADNTYRFEFNHDLRFGGPAPVGTSAGAAARRRIGEIRFQGEPFFPPEELRKKLKLKQGQTSDFFAIRKGVDRLETWYRKNDLLESRVRLQRDVQNGAVDLNFEIRPGPRVRFEFSGDTISDSISRQVREIWAEGVFDAQRAGDASLLIREDLIRRGHLQPKVDYRIERPAEDEKLVRFEVAAGPRFKDVPIDFPGASAISPEVLRQRIEEADLSSKLIADPPAAVDFLTALYRSEGYLSAQVKPPELRVSPDGAQASIEIAVQEGPAAQVDSIRLEGNRVLDDETLLAAIPLKAAAPYRPALRESSRQKLQDLYWAKGYNDVQIEDVTRVPKPGEPFEVLYRIREGRRGVVREIRAEGHSRTNESFILRQIEIAPGDPLIFEKLSRSRKRLYDTGAYSLVEIDSEPIDEGQDDENKPIRLKIRVRELRPFELRYGGFYDTDRGLGVTTDFRNRNSLGNARVLGFRTRYDGDVREMRGYFSQPALKNLPLKTTIDGFLRREIRPDFITDRQGVSLQQEAKLRDRFVFSYGYRFERNDTFERDPDPIFGFDIPPFNVAALTTTLTRDTRDDILDATRGNFTSAGLEYAQDFLGSDLRFVRFYGQHYRYYPLTKPEEIPWSGGEKQPRWVFASGVRVGLAKGLGGQILVPSERFFAGGGTTIRGFEQDAIGQETDLFGGGDALFIFNNELRFPIFNIFDGVAFVDVGNVYAAVSDFDPFDLREAAGLGLRVRTPYFLIRLDYGIKLDRQPGESRGEFFFSIGQAF